MTTDAGHQAIWDLSLLPEAKAQFLVVTDTHYILQDNAQAGEWSAVSEFPARTERALRLAGALPHDFAVHLGDISHEYPETGRAEIAQQAALTQFAGHGLAFHQAAGNMDIGDKPDPTSPAGWVTEETLAGWHQRCGPSWHSFVNGEIHGIVLNTQIMNGPLAAAKEQAAWFESELDSTTAERIFLFLHMPIYYVDRDEHSLGFYNSLDEPARTWLLDLIDRYNIEMVFSGHTHTVELNCYGGCRMWVAPSTATSRAGLAEAYALIPPDRGRGDVDKLGFYFVRTTGNGTSVHLVRTGRDTPALDPQSGQRLIMSRTSRDLPDGRIGIFGTHPLGHPNPGPVIWPSIVRQPVRDDFRFASMLEMGARFVRVPASDLTTPTEAERLQVLRDEGVDIEPYWLWSEHSDLATEVTSHRGALDRAEIVIPGSSTPPKRLLQQVADLNAQGVAVKLSAALVEPSPHSGYHMRTRVGFLPDEIPALEALLEEHDLSLERIALRLMTTQPVVDQVSKASSGLTGRIKGVDWYLDFDSEDDLHNATVSAQAALAISTVPGGRLVLGPHVDLDRSMDVARGLIDRLSNPNPAFTVARTLNSLLFGSAGDFELVDASSRNGVEVRRGDTSVRLLDPGSRVETSLSKSMQDKVNSETSLTWYDLVGGLSENVDSVVRLEALINGLSGPAALVTRPRLM